MTTHGSASDVLRPVIVANCSGFFGDRLSAAKEMVEGGPIDVLTGDWLAELTMGILAAQQARDPSRGYAATFLKQLEDVLVTCKEKGIRIVSNAGGLNPEACADAATALAEMLGTPVRVAYVTGDNVTEHFNALRAGGWPATHIHTAESLDTLGSEPLVANAYMGCWGIVEALEAGADIVITGRVSDASPVVAAAAWHHGWARDDWNALAGAVAAGHVIECGAQAVGGNYSRFTELPNLNHAGFPLAEIEADGSATIAKHPNTGGAITVDTVTAQLVYEIDGPRYFSPDAVTNLDTLQLEQVGLDRVRVSGTRGDAAPAQLKVGAIMAGGWRSAMTFVITGLDVEKKVEVAERETWDLIPGGREAFDDVRVRLLRADNPDPQSFEEALALLTISVSTKDKALATRFSRAAVESVLASYPGLHFTGPPDAPSAYAVFWPTLLDASELTQEVVFEGKRWPTGPVPRAGKNTEYPPTLPPTAPQATSPNSGATDVRLPLGRVALGRSGDKGANATLGIWGRDGATHAWLQREFTIERWHQLLPQAARLELRPWELPNLRAVGVTVVGLLGQGAAANLDIDMQAKGLAEYVLAREVSIPAELAPKA